MNDELHELDAALATGLHLDDYVDESDLADEKYDRFKYDQYDWSAGGFSPNYLVIRLGGVKTDRPKSPHSGVYFTVASLRCRRLLTDGGQQWYPTVEYWRDENGEKMDRIKRVTSAHGVGGREDYRNIAMHRVITRTENAGRHVIVDHRGEGSLDNRDEALWVTNLIGNNYTAKRKRKTGLLPGVDWRATKLKTHVRGVISIAGVKERSEECWPLADQRFAHEWYVARRDEILKELGLNNDWVNPTKPPPHLVFPPMKRRFYIPSTFGSHTAEQREEIPF